MDHVDDLERCVASIVENSSYRNFECIIIENNSCEEATFAFYRELEARYPQVRVERYEGSFNFSDINNFGASKAKGEYLLLLNNDTKIINADWLEELLGYGMRPDVGIVGARLYYGDDTIQHAGVILGLGGMAGHAFVQYPKYNPGYFCRIITAQDLSAVTAACMLVRRQVYEEVGGLSVDLAVAFNDIDFCLKVRNAGYLVVYNPYVELYHYESKSRGLEDTPEKLERFQKEIAVLEEHWPDVFKKPDPYYNPNLTLKRSDYGLRKLWAGR
jgi:GT2 family glycosyltransferase